MLYVDDGMYVDVGVCKWVDVNVCVNHDAGKMDTGAVCRY